MDLYMTYGGRHNQELMDIFKRSNIVNEIKRRKLEWAGHAYKKQNFMIQRVIQENGVDQGYVGRMTSEKISGMLQEKMMETGIRRR